jgi:hypothetical protein
MIVEATSTDEVATKLNGLPLVCAGFLQTPMIVPLRPYLGFAPRSSAAEPVRPIRAS